ncbi:Bgt-51934 [Blumeria graminis f. sp. tritici]|uniref:Bgt-51934 n=1 Tax=Blumeria graminis f. sp. tritici TaxID=62690 RepID=A0A9X9QGI0_BLUGR|nr:Bgt-51934 [Blumeria graminis f. sp. tritici]
MNANLVLALLSKHPHLMYIELAVVTPISPSIANLSYIPKAASLTFSYLVIVCSCIAKTHDRCYLYIINSSFDVRDTHTLWRPLPG